MKAVHVIVLGTLTLGLSALASAGSLSANDPQIKTGGPLGASSVATLALSAPVPAIIFTPNFVIQSPSGTSPSTSPCILIEGSLMQTSDQCYFENDISYTTNGSGNTISQLTFDALGIPFSTVSCGFLAGSPFSNCGVEPIPGGTEVDFTGGSIPFHADFTLDFAGFPTNFDFQSTAAVTPEPGTMALLLAGLGSLVIRRKRS